MQFCIGNCDKQNVVIKTWVWATLLYGDTHFLSTDLSLTLVVLDSVINVTEPDERENITLTSCFQADVQETRRRAAVFELRFLNSSTADLYSDFFNSTSYIIVPAGFNGFFMECVDTTIVGDNSIEEDEVIEYELLPLSELDFLQYPNASTSPLRIYISDNDGKYEV